MTPEEAKEKSHEIVKLVNKFHPAVVAYVNTKTAVAGRDIDIPPSVIDDLKADALAAGRAMYALLAEFPGIG